MHLKFVARLSPAFDRLLDGGVSTGKVVEFAGSSGVGKTQLCLQLALAAASPKPSQQMKSSPNFKLELQSSCSASSQSAHEASTDSGPTVLFIDTAHSFSPARLLEMARCSEASCMSSSTDTKPTAFAPEVALNNIRCLRAFNPLQLISVLEHARAALETRSDDFFSRCRFVQLFPPAFLAPSNVSGSFPFFPLSRSLESSQTFNR